MRHQPGAEDPLCYMHLTDTFNNQVLVLLVVINDPTSPRFDIDVDAQGAVNPTGHRRAQRRRGVARDGVRPRAGAGAPGPARHQADAAAL
ncbi:MAG: hypothetical protein M5R40_05755 [Anaerolineae bacterium]|nr:hypothetical protein [Anaerolineae bacterium]